VLKLVEEIKPSVLSKNEIENMLTKISPEEVEKAKKISLTPLKETIFFKGEPGGAIIMDIDGNKYIDCTAQAWTLNIGYCQPDVLYTVLTQMKRLTHVRYGYPTIPRLKLLLKLSEIAPGNLKKVSFNNEGGGMAIEAAMKLAMVNSKKIGGHIFITFWRGYHGATLATIPASMILRVVVRFPGFGLDRFVKLPYPYCYRCPFGEKEYPDCGIICASFVERALTEAVSAPVIGMIIEPMQGPGGQIPAPPEFLKELRRICNEYNIFLIFDEAQVAFGRCGRMFAAEYYNVIPDMIALTKALGGGFPIGATLAREDLKEFTEGEEHTTFGSNPIMFAAALASIEVIQRLNLPKRAEEMGNYIMGRLREMQETYEVIGDVRGAGLFIGVELVKDRKTKEPLNFLKVDMFLKEAFKRGVIFDVSMPIISEKGQIIRNVIKIKPPLTITREQVDRALEVFEECLKKVSK